MLSHLPLVVVVVVEGWHHIGALLPALAVILVSAKSRTALVAGSFP
jgi:hypothetical protein